MLRIIVAPTIALTAVFLLSATSSGDVAEPFTVKVVGKAEVAMPPLIERAYDGRAAKVSVTPVKGAPNKWKVSYARASYRCSLHGVGTRDRIEIPAKQRCRIDFKELPYRGTVFAYVERGLISTNKVGETTLEISGTVDGSIERYVNVVVLGRTLRSWVPFPTPPGTASYSGKSPKR